MLDHGHGLSSAFLHMKSITVKVGERVSQGQKISTVGETERAAGPHRNWRVNWFKVLLNPALVLKLRGEVRATSFAIAKAGDSQQRAPLDRRAGVTPRSPEPDADGWH